MSMKQSDKLFVIFKLLKYVLQRYISDLHQDKALTAQGSRYSMFVGE